MTTTDKKLLQYLSHIIARNTIEAIKCEVCDKTTKDLGRHHWNYYKPRDVIILCNTCHSYIHSFDAIGFKKRKKVKPISKEVIQKEEEILYNFNFLPVVEISE